MKNNKVIIINGSSGAGKDEFIKIFNKYTDITVFNHSTIDNIRMSLYNLGYKFDKMDFLARKLMSDIKKFLTDYDNIPFKDMIDQYENYDSFMNGFILFIHCREPDEIQQFVDHFEDCTTLLMKRKGLTVPKNKSDMNVNNFQYDYVINNDGTLKDLEVTAKQFIKDIEEEE